MNDFDNLCKGCMNELGDNDICPICGYDKNEEPPKMSLPIGTILEDRYAIGKCLGSNTEGFNYIAYDIIDKSPVFIREFFPADLCLRGQDGKAIITKVGFKNDFINYKDSFLNYFRSLAKMKDLKSIMTPYNIFSTNNTAYIVYEWLDIIPLPEYIKRSGGNIDWDMARPLFMPLISDLISLNSIGISHLGICPSNLVITTNGKMMLIGFSIKETRSAGSSLTPNLYSGYSAIEQYNPVYGIGQVTDVYGLAASLLFALVGTNPQGAISRKNDDRLFIPTSLLKRIPPHVVTAIANALQVFPQNRTKTFERLRDELSISPTLMNLELTELNEASNSNKKSSAKNKEKKELSNFTWGVIAAISAFAVFMIIAVVLLWGDTFNKNNSSSSDTSSFESTSAYSSAPSENYISAPNLRGQTIKNAQSLSSSNNDFNILTLSQEFDNIIPEGCIISQNPEPGTQIEKGTSIAVTISKGLKMRTLPSIIGLSLSEASMKVTSAGLIPVQIDDYSNIIDEGLIIGYDNAESGDLMEYHSEVKIIVSKGKKPNK